jgi:hypothetical protein
MCHSRWITTANRILRLYSSEADPSENLQVLATFIMRVYVPMHLCIKARPSISDGAMHVMMQIELCRYLRPDLLGIVHKVMSQNSYFAHPEAIMVAMLADNRREVRMEGYQKVKKALNLNISRRVYKKPEILFDATHYSRLVAWTEDDYTLPRPLCHMTTDSVKAAICDLPPPLRLDYPCHTQQVERTVKLVTEAASSVCGYERRNGLILTTIRARKERSTITDPQ